MKLRGWLLLLLFVHVLLHPLVHAIGTSATSDSVAISASSTPRDASLNSSDRCELCRVGHNTVVIQQPKVELLNPRWIHTTLQSVNCASLQADRSLPSRAPPTL